MRKPISDVLDNIEMMSNTEASCESRIEKMRKFLSSPLTRKKPSGSQTKTFGTSLDVLIQRTPSEAAVPFIVTRICQYIESTGLMHEGLFRISGNARLIERLKLCFDQSGDAPLETEGDVASAAALLKLFLRELPDPIIPLGMHQQFLNAVKGNVKEESINQLMLLVEKLPFANFSLLKYLSFFLMQVSHFEEQNRMSASSLGIVFGPNLFRVAEDFGGLKEQSLTNQIVTYFITDYYAIFHDEPDHLGKLNHLTRSLDSEMKNTMPMSANHSMVSSWPKLSSYTSIMSSLSLRPLSVSIPAVEDFPLTSLTESSNNDEHILMVNNSVGQNQEIPQNEQISDQSEKEEINGNTSSARRRRKERKLLKEDVIASYSTFDSMLHMSAKTSGDVLDSFMEEKPLIHSVRDTNGSVKASHCDAADLPDMRRPMNPINHEPVRGKKQVFEKVSMEPLADQQSTTSSYLANDFASTPREVHPGDRTAHDGSKTQNQTSYSSSSAAAKQLHDAGTPYAEPVAIIRSAIDSIDMPKEGATKANFSSSSKVTEEARDNDSLKENHDAILSRSELRESSSSSTPDERSMAAKRFSYDSKHHRYRRGHRYFKKQHSTSDSRRALKPLRALPSDHVDSEDGNDKVGDFQEQLDTVCVKDSVPPSDLDIVPGIHTGLANGSCTSQRYSWSVLERFQDGEETTAVSPVHQFLRVSSSSEAPLSPSAYRSYLSHRSPHLDPNMPPSPPVEQEDLATGGVDDANSSTIKQLSKKIHGIKKKLKQFEENFEATHSYRPSHAEKSYYPEVKRLIADLNQARQDLKELKGESSAVDAPSADQWNPPDEKFPHLSPRTMRHKNTCHLAVGPLLTGSDSVSVQESLKEALQYLDERRKIMQRPEALEEMTREQLVEEKYTIQKLLLQIEDIHGRPASKMHRDLMRPLYDRYRTLKRVLSRSSSFGSTSKLKESVELQPILEHETMNFGSLEEHNQPLEAEISSGGSIEKCDVEVDKEINEDRTQHSESSLYLADKTKLKEIIEPIIRSRANLPIHELSLSELFDQQQQARNEKRKLRKILKEFEMQFQKEHGRKVKREDKREMEPVYAEYKNVRARLKLLEALAAKHGQKHKY